MTKYTFNKYNVAHNLSRKGYVLVPDQVYDNQADFDLKTFPIRKLDGKKGRGMLIGDAYDLNGSGTGDMVVKIIR